MKKTAKKKKWLTLAKTTNTAVETSLKWICIDSNLVGSVRNYIIGDRSEDQKEKNEFRGNRLSKTRISRGISTQDCKEMYEKM